MEEGMNAESGLQLLSRLSTNGIDLSNFEPVLFPIRNQYPLEIYDSIVLIGETGCGKTILMTHLIAKCILSKEYGGLGLSAMLINTEQQFNISVLFKMLLKYLTEGGCKTPNYEMKTCLRRLNLLPFHDVMTLKLTFMKLASSVQDCEELGLIAYDSPSTFYFTECLADKKIIRKQDYIMDTLSNLLKNGCAHRNVLLVITLTDSFCYPHGLFKLDSLRSKSKTHHIYLNRILPKINERKSISKYTAKLKYRIGNNELCDIFEFNVNEDGIYWTE